MNLSGGFTQVELDVSVLTGIDNDIDTMLQETGALVHLDDDI